VDPSWKRKVDLLIVQVIYIDHIVLLVLRPAISKPSGGIVIDILIFKVLPSGVSECLDRVQ
jgi:hypothetical protein